MEGDVETDNSHRYKYQYTCDYFSPPQLALPCNDQFAAHPRTDDILDFIRHQSPSFG